MTKYVQILKQAVLSLTGKGVKDKIDKVVNRLDLSGNVQKAMMPLAL